MIGEVRGKCSCQFDEVLSSMDSAFREYQV